MEIPTFTTGDIAQLTKITGDPDLDMFFGQNLRVVKTEHVPSEDDSYFPLDLATLEAESGEQITANFFELRHV